MHAQAFFQIIVIIAVLVVVYLVAVRFSPDPLVTRIVQIVVFLIALWVAFFKVLPMAGIG